MDKVLEEGVTIFRLVEFGLAQRLESLLLDSESSEDTEGLAPASDSQSELSVILIKNLTQ